jgi:hypothetical protein
MFTDYKSAALPTELIRHFGDVRYFCASYSVEFGQEQYLKIASRQYGGEKFRKGIQKRQPID